MKESAVMKSESKEIKECAKELHFLVDKLYLQFCEGELCTKCKELILEDAEKKYLSAVIKPFRNRVKYITKEETFDCPTDCPTEFIHIDLSDGDIADFPNFKANTMYKGMEVDKYYTLEELGL